MAFAKVLSNIGALTWVMKIFFIFKLFIFIRLELCCGFFLQICILRFYCPLLCKILEMSIQEILLNFKMSRSVSLFCVQSLSFLHHCQLLFFLLLQSCSFLCLVSQVLVSKSSVMSHPVHVHLFCLAVSQALSMICKAICCAPLLMEPCQLKIYIVQTLSM